ncbi:MAG: hypothetical protein ACJAT2_002352 [Bacteriovoracaceae bacterium]|jgi:hypothetical protein
MLLDTKDEAQLTVLWLTRRNVKFPRHDGITRGLRIVKEDRMKILLLLSILYLVAADIIAWDKLILIIFS